MGTETHQGHRQRLRTRFVQSGLDGFHDYEAVELLLTQAIPRRDVKPLAKGLIARFGSLRGVCDAPWSELAEIPGLGEAGATALKVVRAAAERILFEQALGTAPLETPEAVVAYLNLHLGGLSEERFAVLLLTQAHRVLGIETIALGGMASAPVTPQRIFAAAFKAASPALILVHNHPGGSLEPSPDDVALTRRIQQLAEGLDIRLLDHLIVTRQGWTSLARRGVMSRPTTSL